MKTSSESVVFHLIVIILLVIVTGFYQQPIAYGLHQYHHYKHWNRKPPYTTLYVYTQPVQKICTILEHNGKVVQAQDQPPIIPNSSNSTSKHYMPGQNAYQVSSNENTGQLLVGIHM